MIEGRHRQEILSRGIFVWEDDPVSGGPLVKVNAPSRPRRGLSFLIEDADPVPPSLYSPGDKRFSYWAAVEGLTRSINFWGKILASLKLAESWQNGSRQIRVRINSLKEPNCYYSRDRIEFGVAKQGEKVTRLSDSPETVARLVGHAVLDILRPELWDALLDEVAAFHSSFATISGILSTLQLETYRKAIIRETGGYLHHPSRLTGAAEHFGDRGLRDVFTAFYYEDPVRLPPNAPPHILSSEPHSFSQIFSGASVQALSAMFRASDLSAKDLLTVTVDFGTLLADAVRRCELRARFFSSVARALLEAERERYGGRYRQSLEAAFVGRGILPLTSQGTPPSFEPTQWIPLESDEWRFQLLEQLRNMDPTLFEKLVGDVLGKLNFEEVEHKGRSGDEGIDLVCLRKSDFQTDRFFVQCKRYSAKITAEQVRDFRGALGGRGERGIFVTTSSFTGPAISEAKREGLAPLSLIDGRKFCDILRDLGLGVNSKQVTVVSLDPAGLGALGEPTAKSD